MLGGMKKTKRNGRELFGNGPPSPHKSAVNVHGFFPQQPPLQCKLVPVKLGQNRALSTCEKFKIGTVFHAKGSQLPRQSTLV